jgi:hypothetical protein
LPFAATTRSPTLDDAVFSSAAPAGVLDAAGLDAVGLGLVALEDVEDAPGLPPQAVRAMARARMPSPVPSCFFMVCSFACTGRGRAGS